MEMVKRWAGSCAAKKTLSLCVAGIIVSLGAAIHLAQQNAWAVAVPPSATVAFQYTSWTVNAADGAARIGVTITGAPTATVSVDYATVAGGTAKPYHDYIPAEGTLTWSPSEAGTTKYFFVKLLEHRHRDAARTVDLALSSPVGGTLGSSTSILTIVGTHTIQCRAE